MYVSGSYRGGGESPKPSFSPAQSPPGLGADLVERATRVFVPTYRPAPIVLHRGEGCWVFDVDGKKYLDFAAGVAVSALGHGHPAVVAAVKAQAERLFHTSNLYYNQPSIEFAERLVSTSGLERVFLCNSGAEANEAAFKAARRYFHDQKDTARNEIVAFLGSFHGRTLGALAATGQPKYHEGFGPMPEGFVHVPYGDLSALDARVTEKTAAVIVEVIQGEGGVCLPPQGFLREAATLARARGALLIVDEIQTGFGRTGWLFAHQAEGITPDIMTLAKGIGCGVPVGAMLCTARVGSCLTLGTHGSTFGGNPLAAAAGRAAFDLVADAVFLEHVKAVGRHLIEGLARIQTRSPVFKEVRGRGLMVGVELASNLEFDARSVVDACRAQGVLIHTAGTRVLRILPPLIVHAEEIDAGLLRLEQALVALMTKKSG